MSRLPKSRSPWTLSNYDRIFEPEILTLLWRSLWLAGITTIVSLIVAYPVALVIATAEMKWKPWLLLIIILPFWTNLLIRTYALLNILGSRGRINDVLYYLWSWADTVLGWIGLGWVMGGPVRSREVPRHRIGRRHRPGLFRAAVCNPTDLFVVGKDGQVLP